MERATELLTARELAKRLRVSPGTVLAWSRHRTIPMLRLSPKVIRYDLAAVLRALAERQESGVSNG